MRKKPIIILYHYGLKPEKKRPDAIIFKIWLAGMVVAIIAVLIKIITNL